MGKFRKKPVVIEARQLTPENAEELINWCGGLPLVGSELRVNGITIKTLEGAMTARHDDWIVKGVKGEFYPCKPDIFAASYEPVDLKADRSALPESMVAVDRKDVRAAAALIRDHAGSDVQTQELVWRLFDAVKKDKKDLR